MALSLFFKMSRFIDVATIIGIVLYCIYENLKSEDQAFAYVPFFKVAFQRNPAPNWWSLPHEHEQEMPCFLRPEAHSMLTAICTSLGYVLCVAFLLTCTLPKIRNKTDKALLIWMILALTSVLFFWAATMVFNNTLGMLLFTFVATGHTFVDSVLPLILMSKCSVEVGYSLATALTILCTVAVGKQWIMESRFLTSATLATFPVHSLVKLAITTLEDTPKTGVLLAIWWLHCAPEDIQAMTSSLIIDGRPGSGTWRGCSLPLTGAAFHYLVMVPLFHYYVILAEKEAQKKRINGRINPSLLTPRLPHSDDYVILAEKEAQKKRID